MAEELSPATRQEDYLAAIAGQDVTPPEPATRLEEWLNLIAEHGEAVSPTPAAEDEGKVLTAGDDGTARWQTASGGDSPFEKRISLTGTYDNGFFTNVTANPTLTDLAADMSVGSAKTLLADLQYTADDFPFKVPLFGTLLKTSDRIEASLSGLNAFDRYIYDGLGDNFGESDVWSVEIISLQ